MTKAGEQNRWGRFIFEDEQAERVAAGDMAAVWEFIEDNRKHLTCWARKFLRNRLWFVPQGYYEVDELLNQIYVDFPYYRLMKDGYFTDEAALGRSIFCSFLGISCGGYRWNWKRLKYEDSLEATRGEDEEGTPLTLGGVIPSNEPTPLQVLLEKEHMREIVPKMLEVIESVLRERLRRQDSYEEELREIVEELFTGMTLEEVQAYAAESKQAGESVSS